jgi:hypothetical protein
MAEQNLDIVVRVRGGQVASSEIKGVGSAVQGVGTQTETVNSKTSALTQTLKGMATAAVAYKGFAYIKDAIKETADLTKQTAGLSRITGLDTQTSAGWVELAKERGIQSKQLNQGFISLNKNITAAQGGSKSAREAFYALGLSSDDLAKADATTRMSMLADAFKATTDPIQKAALAQKLFGRQAQSMLPVLDQGGKALTDQTTKLGKQTGLTGDAAKSSMEFVKMQREWGATTMQLKVAVGTALMPVLVTLAQAITPLVQGFANAMTHSGAFRFAVISLTAALVTFVAVLFVASASFAWIPALIAGIGIALVMLYTKCAWFRDSVNAVAAAAVAAFNWIKNAAIAIFNWVKANWPLLLAILGGPFGAAAAVILTHLNNIKSAAQSVWNFLKGLGSFIAGAFAGAWNTAAGAVRAVVSAIQAVVDTAKSIASLPSKALSLIGNVPGASAVGLQGGGTITSAGVAVVGEAGPELVHLPAGAQVIPNHAIGASYGGGSGGGRVVVPVYLDTRQIALAYGDFTADQQAAR